MSPGSPSQVIPFPLSAKLFAFDKDDGTLVALSSPAEAASHCKAVDVQDGYWIFFSDDGSPLLARFEPQDPDDDTALGPGPYTLERAMSGLWLQERLSRVTKVSGCGLATVADLEETLKVNRSKRLPPATPRR
ncbi:MAG: hypothetical protein IPJ28_23510 [Betaproteobacteria bacterium]|nr:hypothetical protein [Betaproteobacteria bacterium]